MFRNKSQRNILPTCPNQRGFTLIELIIVIFVLVMVTTVTITNFRNGEKRKAVQLGVDTVSTTIRLAQNYTLAGRVIPTNATKVHDSSLLCPLPTKIPVDYRVVFNVSTPTQYGLYATDRCDDVWLIETFKLPQRTRIQTNGSGLNMGNVNYSSLQFKFTTPFARIQGAGTHDFAAASFQDFDQAYVSIESSVDDSLVKTVQVDAISGRIGQ